MSDSDDRDAIITPLFDIEVDCALLADPNCPQCLHQMTLVGEPDKTFWACADPECGVTRLF